MRPWRGVEQSTLAYPVSLHVVDRDKSTAVFHNKIGIVRIRVSTHLLPCRLPL